MTIIKNDRGREFGGFTKAEWDSTTGDKYDNEAFLFSLTSNQKFLYNKNGKAIYCYSGNGPCFGNGHNIGFDNSTFDQDNGGYASVCRFTSFDVPVGGVALAGCQWPERFKCLEMEVY